MSMHGNTSMGKWATRKGYKYVYPGTLKLADPPSQDKQIGVTQGKKVANIQALYSSLLRNLQGFWELGTLRVNKTL